MNLQSIAQGVLPEKLYQQLASSSVAKRLARGSLWGLIGSASSRILVLIAMILVARILGKTGFGELGVIQSTLGVAGLMAGMGLGATATRFIARYAVEDPVKTGRIIGMLRVVNLATIVITAAVIFLGSSLIAAEVLSAPHLKQALIIGIALMTVNTLRGLQNGALAGFEKFDTIAKLNIAEGVASLIGMLSLATLWGLNGALLGLIVGSAVSWLGGLQAFNQQIAKHQIPIQYKNSFAERKILTGYSLPSFMANLIGTPVLWYCITLVAKGPNGYDEMGLYNAAYQWHGPMILVPMIIMSTSVPILVKEWAAGNVARFRKITLWISAGTLAIAIPPALIVSVASPWVMGLYGSAFSQGWLIMVLVLMAAPFHALSNIASGALLGMNKAWLVFAANVVWASVMLCLALWIIPGLQARGLATAFIAAYACQAAFLVVTVLLSTRNVMKQSLPVQNEPCKNNY